MPEISDKRGKGTEIGVMGKQEAGVEDGD